jgi:aryl-alcohol dehydrogenase-like predicted oxidoreductase
VEYRRVGDSGLVVSELSFGAATFGGSGDFFGAWGDTGVDEARRIIDMCLDAGITLFDTADVYSDGASEEVLGAALVGRRDRVLISTKAALPVGEGPGDAGASRSRLIDAVEKALRRLQTDRIDLFQLHAYDAGTPIDEVLDTLDVLVAQGKIRYTGVSNFAGWQLMKSLSAADAAHRTRYVAHQVYYSLIGRDYEWELMIGFRARLATALRAVSYAHRRMRASFRLASSMSWRRASGWTSGSGARAASLAITLPSLSRIFAARIPHCRFSN